MILTDLWLHNFRNHKKLHVQFKSGVTAIVGTNGSGKSSIIEAIQFLLTGELFEGAKKEDGIMLGTDSGYVVGSFTLNEKEGRLERHLDVSKVILTYDGVIYKKATEVKEMWDKLLQLNAEIIKKVVIASQGNIPQLFSGDTSVREKVFQKIFLVPPTEQLRSMIWKDYLQQAPPIVPEEDLLQLQNLLERLNQDAENLHHEKDALPLLSDVEVAQRQEYMRLLRKCIEDEGKSAILNESRVQIIGEHQDIRNELEAVADKLKIDIDKYRRMHTALLQHKGLYAQRLKLEANLTKLGPVPTDIEEKRNAYQATVNNHIDIGKQIYLARSMRQSVGDEIKVLDGLKGKGTCPTCKQPLQDASQHIKELQKKFEDLLFVQAELEKQFESLTKVKSAQFDEICDLEQLIDRVSSTSEQIAQLKNIVFDQDTYDSISAVLERYEQLTKEKAQLELQAARLENRMADLGREIDGLSIYDGSTDGSTARTELEMVSHELSVQTEVVRTLQQLSVDLKVKEAEIKTLNDRIRNTEENQKKNQFRNKYVATLRKAYDVLHASQFPRRLIMSYADIVTQYLQENLEMFDIPYKARVADNFKIEMIDDHDRVLPKVSGGQQVMIGISLHLALHDLFSQSFPMMIIDEGTTHLDGGNRTAYFDMIRGLKVKSKLKQIIIIDHDPQIAEVVDQVVELKSND